uniref:Integron gene cassette protein n=1 Tax=Steinernema glaseri TaxID=37863 RepID=A0A1I7ZMI4_9BILA
MFLREERNMSVVRAQKRTHSGPNYGRRSSALLHACSPSHHPVQPQIRVRASEEVINRGRSAGSECKGMALGPGLPVMNKAPKAHSTVKKRTIESGRVNHVTHVPFVFGVYRPVKSIEAASSRRAKRG